MRKELEIFEDNIKGKIHTIRGVKIILDSDIARMYDVETRNLNKAVKRNISKFPKDFCFQLTNTEFESLMFQFGTSSWGGVRKLPYAFTEHGIAALSGVLKSSKASEINIRIIRIFVSMRKFISENAEVFTRLDSFEKFRIDSNEKFEKIFDYMSLNEPKQGIFYNGQIFDAHKFVSDLIRSANKSIILLDNYIDDTVLTLFAKRKKNVEVQIYTKKLTTEIRLDLNKFNAQYDNIIVKEFNDSHDRFLIIDDKVYHFGASLKDLGKKWFAFSKFEKEILDMLEKLK